VLVFANHHQQFSIIAANVTLKLTVVGLSPTRVYSSTIPVALLLRLPVCGCGTGNNSQQGKKRYPTQLLSAFQQKLSYSQCMHKHYPPRKTIG